MFEFLQSNFKYYNYYYDGVTPVWLRKSAQTCTKLSQQAGTLTRLSGHMAALIYLRRHPTIRLW